MTTATAEPKTTQEPEAATEAVADETLIEKAQEAAEEKEVAQQDTEREEREKVLERFRKREMLLASKGREIAYTQRRFEALKAELKAQKGEYDLILAINPEEPEEEQGELPLQDSNAGDVKKVVAEESDETDEAEPVTVEKTEARISAECEYFDEIGESYPADEELTEYLVVATIVDDIETIFNINNSTWENQDADHDPDDLRGGAYEFQRGEKGIYLVMLNPDGSVYAAVETYSHDENLIAALNQETEKNQTNQSENQSGESNADTLEADTPEPLDDALAEKYEMYNQAVALVVKAQRASLAFLQRQIGADYTKGKAILDKMCEENIIAYDGKKYTVLKGSKTK